MKRIEAEIRYSPEFAFSRFLRKRMLKYKYAIDIIKAMAPSLACKARLERFTPGVSSVLCMLLPPMALVKVVKTAEIMYNIIAAFNRKPEGFIFTEMNKMKAGIKKMTGNKVVEECDNIKSVICIEKMGYLVNRKYRRFTMKKILRYEKIHTRKLI